MEWALKVVGILQARMGSSRLPGKVLMQAAGMPLIWHMVNRVRRASRLDELWLATSVDPANDPLADEMDSAGIPVFRGSEDDVLSRFSAVAEKTGADWIVRLTGDCPLHDPEIIDAVTSYAVAHADCFDYVSNCLQPTYPDGLDVEVFTQDALSRAAREATTSLQREHVTPFIHRYHDGPGPFRVGHFVGPRDFSHLRWTVDEPEDYQVVKEIFEALYPVNPEFGWLDVLDLVTRRPELIVGNSKIVRNEGFLKALAQSREEM
jgi:spore coat polysaccharide biosynthesis protein SpsF